MSTCLLAVSQYNFERGRNWGLGILLMIHTLLACKMNPIISKLYNNITTAAVAALTNIQAVQLPLQELSSHHRMHINYYPVTFTLWNNYCPWLRLRSRSTSF